MDYGAPLLNRMTFKDWGRNGMCRHNVFRVHDIPPAAYYQGMPPGCHGKGVDEQKYTFRQGDVCSGGLWDEAVDAPLVYPFVADSQGFCYVPRLTVEDPMVGWHGPLACEHIRGCPSTDSRKMAKAKLEDCQLGCVWSE
jgi:hypothetical protein